MQKNTVKTNKVKEIVNKVFHITFIAMLAYLIAFFIGMFGFGYDIMHMEPLMTVVVEEGDEDHLGGITYDSKEGKYVTFDPDDESTWPEDYNPCKVIRTNVDED